VSGARQTRSDGLNLSQATGLVWPGFGWVATHSITATMNRTSVIRMVAKHVHERSENEAYSPTPEDPRECFDSFEDATSFCVATPSEIGKFALIPRS